MALRGTGEQPIEHKRAKWPAPVARSLCFEAAFLGKWLQIKSHSLSNGGFLSRVQDKIGSAARTMSAKARWHTDPRALSRDVALNKFPVYVIDDRVAHTPKYSEPLLVRPLGLDRIFEAPVEEFPGSWKNRAAFPGVVANGHHVRDVVPGG